MTIEELLKSAAELTQVPPDAAAEFASAQDALAAELIRRMGLRPDLERMIGAKNGEMMENNSRNFLRFMNSLFHHYAPQVLVETAVWVFRSYRAHGFQVSYWPANLDTTVELLREELSAPTFDAVYPYFVWLIVNIPSFTGLSEAVAVKGTVAAHGR